jgi:hypothetical protein
MDDPITLMCIAWQTGCLKIGRMVTTTLGSRDDVINPVRSTSTTRGSDLTLKPVPLKDDLTELMPDSRVIERIITTLLHFLRLL